MDIEEMNDGGTSVVQNVELDEKTVGESSGDAVIGENLDLVGNVVVKLEAILGHSEITIRQLFSLTSGDLVKLDRLANGSIDICLDNKLIAKGELVSVDENFGIKITHIVDNH